MHYVIETVLSTNTGVNLCPSYASIWPDEELCLIKTFVYTEGCNKSCSVFSPDIVESIASQIVTHIFQIHTEQTHSFIFFCIQETEELPVFIFMIFLVFLLALISPKVSWEQSPAC